MAVSRRVFCIIPIDKRADTRLGIIVFTVWVSWRASDFILLGNTVLYPVFNCFLMYIHSYNRVDWRLGWLWLWGLKGYFLLFQRLISNVASPVCVDNHYSLWVAFGVRRGHIVACLCKSERLPLSNQVYWHGKLDKRRRFTVTSPWLWLSNLPVPDAPIPRIHNWYDEIFDVN